MKLFLVALSQAGYRHPWRVCAGLFLFLSLAAVSLWAWPPDPHLDLNSFVPTGKTVSDWRLEAPRETLVYRGTIPDSRRAEWMSRWKAHPEVEDVWDRKMLPPEAGERLRLPSGEELTWIQLRPGIRTLGESKALMRALGEVSRGQGVFLGQSPTRILLHGGKWSEFWRVGLPSLALVLILPWLLFGSLGILLGPIFVSLPVVVAVLALYGQWGSHFSYFSFTLIPVLLCLCTLDSVFLTSRLLGARRDLDFLTGVVEEMARPCILTTVTTSLGLGALAVVTDIPVIQEYGAFGLVGMILALPLVFLLVPVFYRLGAYSNARLKRGKPKGFSAAALVTAFTVAASFGLPRFLEGAQGVKFFEPGHPTQQALNELESHFGSLFPIRFTVSGDSRPERLFLYSRALEQWLYKEGLIRTSLAPWTGRVAEPSSQKVDWDEVAEKSRGWVGVEGGRPTQVSFLAWADSGKATHFEKFEKYLSNFEQTMMAEFTVQKSGAFFVLKGLEQDLVQEMWKAFALCVLASLLVVVGGAIGWRMLPVFAIVNFLPVVGTLGLLGWLGFGAESGLLALPCLLFGIVVDDTIHLFCSFQEEGSWRKAFEKYLPPLQLTSLLLVGVFALQMNSFYAPNRAFGLGGALGVALAYGWDRWVLPALVSQSRKASSG